MILDNTCYERAPYELRLLTLRNSLLAAYYHPFWRRTVDSEFNQRQRNSDSYATRQETLERIKLLWKKEEKRTEKELIIFPREKTGK